MASVPFSSFAQNCALSSSQPLERPTPLDPPYPHVPLDSLPQNCSSILLVCRVCLCSSLPLRYVGIYVLSRICGI
ncbi:unnamed protein product [Arabidopsis halleri]